MKTGTAVIRFVLSLTGFLLPVFFIDATGQAPVVSDIPDQTIDEGQSFLALNLDEYVRDDDNPDDQITWSYSGNEDLNITIDPGHLATVLIPFEDWNGTETITFTATDPDTNNSSDVAIFTVNPVNDPPVVAGIPDQPLNEGTPFQPVDLDDYVTDVDNAKNELEWSASGFTDLSVQIDPGSHVASIIVPNEDWNGTENIVFTASDASDSDNDNAEYTLTAVNDPPVIGNIPDQQVNEGELFAAIVLDNYVTDVDNAKSDLSWTITGNTDLRTNISPSRIADISIPNKWTGSENLTFTVEDPSEASASDDASFSVKAPAAAPTDINLSSATIAENVPVSTVVGILSTVDADFGDTFTYSLVSGTGSDDNTSFSISGDNLITNSLFDFETKSTYSVRVRSTTVGDGLWIEKAFTITITNVNEAPTDITLSNSTIAENLPVNTVVGTFSTTDPDAGGSFTYTLVSGAGSADNGSFNILGAQLRSNEVFDLETKSSYTIRVRTFDGEFSFDKIFTITVTNVNDPPVLASIEGTALAYNEGDGLVQITNTITVSDVDNINLASAIISISANYQGDQDVLAFTNANGITGNWNSGTGIMTLSGSATLSNYQAALRSVRYNNTSTDPNTTTRTVTFRVNDGNDNSNTQSRNISIGASNNPPVLAGIEGSSLAYSEDDGLVQITNTITVSDADNINLASATISISANYQNDQDVLAFTNANGITGSWNSFTGILTLSGSSSVSNYQTALRSVRYNNTSANPNTTTRTVTFRVNDGTDNSNTQSRNITITAINDAPVLAGIEGTPLAYNEGDGLVQITNTITVSDADNINLSSATISISANYQNDQDVLAFTNANGITGNWNSVTGILTLSGSSSVSNYQTALRSVRYNNTSTNPNTATRTVTFRVNDGTDNSNTQNRNITIAILNDAPVLAGIEGTSLAYNEDDGLVQITNSITVSDADNTDLSSATISISANYQNDQDVLAFTNANGITGSWNSGTGILTLSGTSSVSNYQAALRSVRYNNTSADPNITTRTVTFRVNDGIDNSNTQSRNITITAINDAPLLAGIEGTPLVYNEGDGLVQITNTITITDADNINLASAFISISTNYRSNQDVLAFTNANGITGSWNPVTGILTLSGSSSVSNYQTALRSVRYNNTSSNPNTATRTVTFRVNDGTDNSNPQSRNISVTRVGEFTANITGTAGYCASAIMPITLTIIDGRSPFVATLTRSGSSSNKDTVITGIATSPYNIQVKLAGTYTLKSLIDVNLDSAAISGSPVVLSIYPKPSAVLSGGKGICNDGVSTAPLSLNLSGTAPWTFTIRRGTSNDTIYSGISTDPFTINARIIGTSPTTYRMVSISDAHCAGDTTGSGTARVFYINSPVAAISGRDTICTSETGKVNVLFSGTPGPWSITYLKNGLNPTVVPDIQSYSYELVVPGPGTYTLSRVQDAVCTGRVSGTAYVIPYTAATATLSGSATICEHTVTNLNVALTGSSPWKYSYRRNAETPDEVVNITTSPSKIPVKLAGTYTLYEVFDTHCKGTVSGSAIITVTPAPDVNTIGLEPAYNKQDQTWYPIAGEPSGGAFEEGPGVIPYNNQWFFLPTLPPVGTHEVIYYYQTAPGTCFGYDTTVVRVLEAEAVIEFPEGRTKYCQNEESFIITGVNLPNSIGSFTITGGTGLVDNLDNTATIDPSLLTVNEYTITYTYDDDGAPLAINSKFEVGKPPVADFIWQSECFTPGQSITFNNTSTSTFGIISGSSWKVFTITGYDTATTHDITYTFPQPGNHVIELQVQTSYGCTNLINKVFGLRPTRPLKDETFQEDFETAPLSWLSGISEPDSPNSWMLGDPTKGFSGASSGDYCWYTYIPTTTAPREHSWITSPCFDFTGTEKPMLKMDIWRLFNSNRDGANLQATADSGKTWMLIGQLDDGINWFNNYNIRGNPGGSSVGWSNIADAGWIEARHSLDMLKGKSAVQFRISYGSDGTAQNNNGIAFDNFWIGDRNRIALLEHFTNASDVLCAEADSILNLMISADSLNIIDLQYHTSFPGPDPFNEDEPYAPGSRVLYYGLSDVPYALLNGGTKIEHRFDYDIRPLDATTMHIEALKETLFEIIIQKAEIQDNSLNIIVEVTAKKNLPASELTVHIVVIERKITGVTGGNGETTFENVVKAMLPDVAGTTNYKSWVNGEKNTIAPPPWNMEHVINPDDLWVVAFIQDEATQEVYQAAMGLASIPNGIPDEIKGNEPGSRFMVFPNPASERVFVRFDEPVDDEVQLELYNNLGSLVHTLRISKGDDEVEIYAADFPDGLYLIRAISNDQVLGIRKLTIAR